MKKLNMSTKLLTLAIVFTTAAAQFEAEIYKDLPRLGYSDWLSLVDENIIQIPPDKKVAHLQVPLDIEISTSSENEQCSSENGPYCFSSNSPEPISDSPCTSGGSFNACPNVTCDNPFRAVDLNQFTANLTFVASEAEAGEQKVVSSPECGLEVMADAFNFSIVNRTCGIFPRQPFMRFNSSTLEVGVTMIFTVPEPASGIFLRIEALDENRRSAGTTEVSKNSTSGLVETSTNESSADVNILKNLTTGEFAVLLMANGWAIFSKGEIAVTVDFYSSTILSEITLGLGSEDFIGQVTGIQLYTAIIDSNQLYSMYSGEPLAKYLYLPECGCPSDYFDTFGLVENPYYPNTCEDAFQNTLLSYLTRYENYVGKWEAFGQAGWTSDFADEAEIQIKLPQQMLVYAVTGSFFAGGGHKYPSAIELAIIGPDSETKAQVFVSENCLEDYGLPETPLVVEVVRVILPSRRKRMAEQTLPPKCYSLEEFIASGDIDLGEYYETDYPSDLPSDFIIPILGVGEEEYSLSDSLVGDVRIKLIGHHDIQGSNENWYYFNGLSLYTRPHCGGNSFTLLGAPNTMSEYYNFHKPGTKAFTCECPPGITGDMCESCEEAAGVYRYKKDTDVCANCDCSDLTRDENMRCDEETGQCDCGANINFDFAGRQCHWYVSDVKPLYGPNAGGTKVVARVGYLDGYGIDVDVQLSGAPIEYNISESKKELLFLTPEPSTGNTTVDLTINAITLLEIGLAVKIFPFEYLPNPILEDIQPRTTILRGGKNLTVTGYFLDSVFAPKMVIYLRQRNAIVGRFVTECTLVSGEEMTCPTADLTEDAISLLAGEVADAALAPESGSEFSSTPESDSSLSSTTESDSGFTSTSNQFSSTTPFTPESSSRRKRDTSIEDEISDNYLNGYNDVDFTLGYLFDGYDVYKDLLKSPDPELRELSKLYVYDDPVIETFFDEIGEESQDAVTGDLLRLKGRNLDYGVSEGDYVIEIGLGYCSLTALSSNQIACRLPEEEPEVFDGNTITVGNRDLQHVKVVVGNLKIDVGYLYFLRSLWNTSDAFRYGMIALIVVVCLAIIAVILYFVVKKYRSKEGLTSTVIDMDDPSSRYIKNPGHEEVRLWFPGRKLDANIQANVDRCKIPPERLSIGKQIGKGNFGLVHKGQLMLPSGNLKTVAVKTLKDDKEMSFEDMENFLAEGTMMIDFKHENVSSLIGVVSKEGERPMVVLPYMENGDLCSFIKNEELDLVLADMLHFGLQIANGMDYLAKERFVHRDLAARNCMVDGSYIVKISDFGMSRDVYERDYYRMESMNKPLPMKWMAIESLKEGRFSSKSDVWAYGVTMWELLTRGSSPYPGVNNYYIKEYVTTGKRLDRPTICPPIIFEMMCKCWEDNPENRPRFSEIADFLSKLLNGEAAPAAGSDEAAGYYYGRNATKNIPEDYLDVQETEELEDYIIPLTSPANVTDPPNFLENINSEGKTTPTPAKRTHLPVKNDYYNADELVDVYE